MALRLLNQEFDSVQARTTVVPEVQWDILGHVRRQLYTEATECLDAHVLDDIFTCKFVFFRLCGVLKNPAICDEGLLSRNKLDYKKHDALLQSLFKSWNALGKKIEKLKRV